MRKRALIFSIVCLMFVTLNYTYSAFKNTIVGTISGNAKDWVFKVNVDSGTVYNDSYKVHLTGTNGSFNVRISTIGGNESVDYKIELTDNDLVKYYTDSACTNLIENNIYKGNISSNTSSNVTIYYKASSSINDDIYVKVKGNIMEVAMMKNGYSYVSSANGGTEFWNNTYKPYIRAITFENDLSNLPSNCTEENLCWDISYSSSQKKKVYGYLTDSGYKDSTDSTKTLYNLYIVSESKIYAPNNCNSIFSFYKLDSSTHMNLSNLIEINFNNTFDTSRTTIMGSMFKWCFLLTSLDLSNFNTSKVTYMSGMFYGCSKLANLNLNNFDTSKVTDMDGIFYYCNALTTLDLSNFDTSKATDMSSMFFGCSSLISLNLSSFNTANVTYMSQMFEGCSSLTSLNLSSFNTSKVTSMKYMFYNCPKLTTTIDIMNANVTSYSSMFGSAATDSNAKITVNYTAATSTLVDNMIATKSSNSNVVKGTQI